MMDILGQQKLHDAIKNFQNHSEYQKILGVLLKYEIQMLLQRLAEAGEESVVMTIKRTDGTLSVIGSDCGEKFVQCSDGNVITDFKEQFIRYCHSGGCFLGSETETDPHKENSRNVSSSSPETVSHSDLSSSRSQSRGRRSTRKKPVDKTDQTVSELVKNIMHKAREQEISKHKFWVRGAVHDGVKDSISLKSPSLQRSRKSNLKVGQSEVPGESHGNKVMENLNEMDKAIEQTVSQLVENIKAQAELKEKQKGSSGLRQRRKRGHQTKTDEDSSSKTRRYTTGRGRRPKSIAACFPPLILSPENSLNDSLDIQTVIKVEPVDNGYEDSAMDKINGESSGEQETFVEGNDQLNFGRITNVSGGIDGWSEERLESQEDVTGENEDLQVVEESGGEPPEALVVKGMCASEEEIGRRTVETTESSARMDLSSMKMEVDATFEEDLELPFVEEYYEKRGGQFEKVTLNQNESSRPLTPDTCYTPSPRKPGKFNLIHRGYCYIKDKEGKGNTVYWKCGRPNCKGRVIQRNGENIRTQDHTHTPTLQFESNKDEETQSA